MVDGTAEFCEEFFDDVPVPHSCLLGEPNDGWTVASRLLFHERQAVGGGSPYNFNRPKTTRKTQRGSDLVELAPVLDRARRLLTLAEGVREMEDVASTLALEAAIDEIMSWRYQVRTRALVQETLGASFLPRLWREPLQPSLGRALRRPLLLATHELTRRADALAEALVARRAA